MTTLQQPPTPSEVPFRSPFRADRPRPGTTPPGRDPGLGILRDPDPERIFPGFGTIANDIDLQLVQPSLQAEAAITAFKSNIVDQAQTDATLAERTRNTGRLFAAQSLAQSMTFGQTEERKALIDDLLEHTPETVTLPASLQSNLGKISGELKALQDRYLIIVERTQYITNKIDLLPIAYHSGDYGERPTVEDFIDAEGINENTDLTAGDRDLLVRAFTTVQSQDIMVLPEIPLSPQEIEGTLRQLGPNLDLTTYGHLTGTVAEMRSFYRALETPELPPGMTGEEFNSFLTVSGFDEDAIDEARSVRAKVREFREQINLESARRKHMRETLPNDPVAIEELLKDARWQRIQSTPTLHLFYPFIALAQYWDKPLAGAALYYTAPQTIQRITTGLVNSTGLTVAKDNRFFREFSEGLSTAISGPRWLTWGFDSAEDYEKYQVDYDRARETGVNSWLAHRFAFDEWDGHWFHKLLLETVADPLSYIGIGVLPAITKPLGPIGRHVMNFERGWNSAWDSVVLSVARGARTAGGRTISMIADEATRYNARLIRSTVEVAAGRQFIFSIPIEKSAEIVAGLIRQSVKRLDMSKAMETGRSIDYTSSN